MEQTPGAANSEEIPGASEESLNQLIQKGLLTDKLKELLLPNNSKEVTISGIKRMLPVSKAYELRIFSLLKDESKNEKIMNFWKNFLEKYRAEDIFYLFYKFFNSKPNYLQLENDTFDKFDKFDKDFYKETIGKSKESEESEDSKKIEILRIVALFKSYLEWEKEYLTENKIETTVLTVSETVGKTLTSSSEEQNHNSSNIKTSPTKQTDSRLDEEEDPGENPDYTGNYYDTYRRR